MAVAAISRRGSHHESFLYCLPGLYADFHRDSHRISYLARNTMTTTRNGNGNGKKWIAISLPILAAAAGVLGFIYGVGQRGGKITEVVEWKNETAPRIERMDAKGTISFELFHIQYDKEQAQQYERIKELERKAEQIEVLKARLDALEKERKIKNEIGDFLRPREIRPWSERISGRS